MMYSLSMHSDMIFVYDWKFYRDTPFIGNRSMSLPTLDKFVIYYFSIIMHISKFGMTDLEFGLANSFASTQKLLSA